MKALIGKTESITYEEAKDMRDRQMTEFAYYLCQMIDENTEDEEERANAKVNMSAKLGNLLSAEKLVGILTDPDMFLAELPYGETARIGDISEDEDQEG